MSKSVLFVYRGYPFLCSAEKEKPGSSLCHPRRMAE